jgi:serine/threonine protein kinase
LKPENILVESNLKVRLGDMGSALFISDLPRFPLPLYVQSRFYRAPEVLIQRRVPITSKIDIWSLGCLVAELYMACKPECKEFIALFGGRSSSEQLEIIKRVFTRYPSNHKCVEHAIGFESEKMDAVEAHHFIDFITVRTHIALELYSVA